MTIEEFRKTCDIHSCEHCPSKKGGSGMKTISCLKELCCMCKHFKVVRNEFENTINGVCILYRKGICGCCDITLIAPNSMLNGKVSDMPPIDDEFGYYYEEENK